MVDQIIDEVLAFPHKQSTEDLQAFLDAFLDHDTTDRLPEISAPTLVLSGGRDSTSRPELGRAVAELIPGARFEVMEEEAHQPFQEVPDRWNARVDAFWQDVEVRHAARPLSRTAPEDDRLAPADPPAS
jgi:pimeloyl-ACP methyl ester carboxylesterase